MDELKSEVKVITADHVSHHLKEEITAGCDFFFHTLGKQSNEINFKDPVGLDVHFRNSVSSSKDQEHLRFISLHFMDVIIRLAVRRFVKDHH